MPWNNPGGPNRLPADRDLSDRLTESVQTALARSATPGASLALLVDGQPLFAAGIGHRNLERTVALEAGGQFYIYSITKTLIAVLILQLVEQGRMALEAPIQAYLPQVPLDTPVTIRQLLNHTGGIPDYGALPAYTEALKAHPTRPWTAAELLAATLPQGLRFAPGQGWGYSNIGFLLLRQAIEAILHPASLRSALQDRLFAPLDLRQSLVAETLADAQILTPGYSAFFASGGSLHDIRAVYHPGWVSHGVVIATAPDLARIVDAIFSGRFIGPHSRAAMLQPVSVPVKHPFFQQPAYGLGVMIDRGSSYGVIAGHGGGGPGYSAGALHIPNAHGRRITSVALANRDGDEVGLQIAFDAAMMAAGTL